MHHKWLIKAGLFLVMGSSVRAQENKVRAQGNKDYQLLHFTSSHTSFPDTGRVNGHVYDGLLYTKAGHYDDSSVLLCIPRKLKPDQKIDLVFWFHGWHNNIDTAIEFYALARQFIASKRNAILILPEAAKNAADSYGGKLQQQGDFSYLVQDVMTELKKNNIVPANGQPGHIVLAGHSGAFLVIANILKNGQAPVNEVFLFDALYSKVDEFTNWINQDKEHHFVHWFTNHGGGTDEMSDTMMIRLKNRHMDFQLTEEKNVTPAIINNNQILFVHSLREHNVIINDPDDLQLLLENSFCLNGQAPVAEWNPVAAQAPVAAQNPGIRPALLHGNWSANWITCPGVSQRAYGVYHFRKTFEMKTAPDKFIVHLSADNRYRLLVNGQAVCSGPARGDLAHWNFETVDLAPFLHAGENVVAALVWNMGEFAAVGQISNQTAFLLQGDAAPEEIINTNNSWKVIKDSAYSPCSTNMGAVLHTYYAAGPGDEVDGAKYPWGWEQTNYPDSSWLSAASIAHPAPAGYGTDNQWTLVPSPLPLMEEVMQRIPLLRRSTGKGVNNAFIRGNQPFTIPAHDSAIILLDQSYNTTAYPQLLISGGKGSELKMTYSEALFDQHHQKGNRNEIAGKEMIGDYDLFKPDGGLKRLFRPLWMRTYRYLQLTIRTGSEPLIIEDLYGMYTGYPFRENARFTSNDTSLKTLWNIGWRTARLCAGETYFDCPYYEQLQYEGDTRIQALISLYVSGDDRLMRKAITDFYDSRVSEGLTQGRYPSNRLQVIPPFSLYWVSMIYDYWMHRKDDDFIRQNLLPIKGVLDWYEKRIDPDKQMLGPMQWWNFVDWNTHFPNGVPDGATDGNSSVLTLQLAYTLQEASALFSYYGDPAAAGHYTHLADTLTAQTYKWCFDPVKEEMANTPGKSTYSQHANIMGVLTGSIPDNKAKKVMNHVLSDTSLSQCTFYYRFYLTRALKKAGMADLYYASLKPWRDMVANGLTTFAENPDPTRSDCHAWSASPVYDFLATICGITPASPGFNTVSIHPALGELREVQCSMPHPKGVIKVSLTRKGAGGVTGEIELPPLTDGSFYWNGQEINLHPGKQEIKL